MKNINPLIADFYYPPFSKIELEHYCPAIEYAIGIARENIAKIIENTQTPTFENTIEALEFASTKLDQITPIFFNLNHANTSEQMQQLAISISGTLTNFSNDISLNEKLFEKIEYVYNNFDSNNLDTETVELIKKTYKSFIREGASLNTEQKEKYRVITEQLAELSLKFSQNVLAATNDFYLHLTDINDLSGLPSYVKEAGICEAQSRELEGWVYTLAAPSYIPFMQFCDNRDYRELMWTKYNTRCFNCDKYDNQDNILKIVNLRRELAEILGYKNYAQYALEQRMSKNEETVNIFIDDLIEKSISFAKKEWQEIQQYAKSVGFEEEVKPWDFNYYAEKYKIILYQISDDKLKPYFQLENVCKGLFEVIEKLYSIEFIANDQVDKYHEDMVAYDVMHNNEKIALLYMDFFPRSSKSGGAWMTSYADKMIYSGKETIPIVSVVCNFTKPTPSSPSLLTFSEVTTLFHEAGHALHGIFAKGRYPSLNGTNVAWDFVELPSQIMENWAVDDYFLSKWAKHYQTGESIPKEYIVKLKKSENFLSGLGQNRQLSFAICDMMWHTITEPLNVNIREFENKAMKSTKITSFLGNNCFSTAFSHIFAGGYAAGYYSYKWAEVLEADAFSKFTQCGVYNPECANSFRENILSKGGQEDALAIYIKFMGREPNSEALFKKLGLTVK